MDDKMVLVVILRYTNYKVLSITTCFLLQKSLLVQLILLHYFEISIVPI